MSMSLLKFLLKGILFCIVTFCIAYIISLFQENESLEDSNDSMKSLKNSINDILHLDFNTTFNSLSMEDIKSKLLKLEKEFPKNLNLDDFTQNIDGVDFSELFRFHAIMFIFFCIMIAYFSFQVYLFFRKKQK